MDTQNPKRPTTTTPAPEPGALELVENAVGDARTLLKVEIALAKRELTDQLRAVSRAAVILVVAFSFLVVMLALLGVAVALALGGTVMMALGVAGGSLALAVLAGAIGLSLLPGKLLTVTRRQVKDDLQQLEERLT